MVLTSCVAVLIRDQKGYMYVEKLLSNKQVMEIAEPGKVARRRRRRRHRKMAKG